ncbi:MAG TPA: hypothetical protein VIK08_07835 [Candidatus Limnocylindrales bacterium]
MSALYAIQAPPESDWDSTAAFAFLLSLESWAAALIAAFIHAGGSSPSFQR